MPSLVHSSRQTQQHKQLFSVRLQKAVGLLQMANAEFVQSLKSQMSENPFLDGDDLYGIEDTEPSGTALWGSNVPNRGPTRHTSGDSDALSSIATEVSLPAHLHAQLRLLRLDERDFILASILIECLDDAGFLRDSLEAVATCAEGLTPPVQADELHIALARVQSLEPRGVGARDLTECLRLQLDLLALEKDRALCERLLACTGALESGDIRRMARALDCPVEEVRLALQCLRRLDPHPGWRHGGEPTRYAVPDVLARKTRSGWTAVLNEAIVPRLRVNHEYAELHRSHRSANPELDEQLADAKWTVRNVEQRFSTILAVAQAVVRHQQRFLDFGPMAMRPLVLREIAEEVGVHESTVSRVTHEKYIATPSGTFELGYFFSRGMSTESGVDLSPTAIRSLVQQLIRDEPPGKPMSDVALARHLGRQGIKVARRTVTKYRQQLGIRAAEMRSGTPIAPVS